MLEEPIVLTESEIRDLQMSPPVPLTGARNVAVSPPQPASPIITPPPPVVSYAPAEPVQFSVPPPSAPSFHVVAPPTPPVPPTMAPVAPVVSRGIPKRSLMILFGVLVCTVVFGGVAYAYVQQIGPFSVSQYTEATFLSSILAKASDITTASYKFSAALTMPEREKDAVPFTVDPPNAEKVAQYKRDVQRINGLLDQVKNLSYEYGEKRSYDFKTKKYVTKPSRPYPATLTGVPQRRNSGGYVKDPIVALQPYEYSVTAGGSNFTLSATLETEEAINAIRASYNYVATTTIISGNRVTFTKDSRYVNVPTSLPKPFLVSFSDYLRAIPPDVSGSVSVGAMTDLSKEGLPDWRFNATAIGDMGDLTYKVDIEARKKDENYYIRINNIPSIIPYLGSYKGKWIEITPKAASSTKKDDFSYDFNPFAEIATTIADTEEDYKAERAELAKELRSLVELADEVKLIAFKENPIREKVEGRDLYRYKLTIRKEAIVAFYTKILADPAKYKKLRLTKDDGLLDYLKSSKFEKTFDYVNTNTQLTFWTDTAGFPAKVEYRMRIVPPDTAVQLKEKQVVVILSLDLADINTKMNIEKPVDARPIEDVIKEIENNTKDSFSDPDLPTAGVGE